MSAHSRNGPPVATLVDHVAPPSVVQQLHPQWRGGTWSAITGVRITSAVNLLEFRDYAEIPRRERLARAIQEQQQFVSSLFGMANQAAFDLRLTVTPGGAVPIDVAVLCRAWADQVDQAAQNATAYARHVAAAVPRHVNCETITDDGELHGRLYPPHTLPASVPLAAVALTKRGVAAAPSRGDAGETPYFSVVPFTGAQSDWIGVYATLAASTVPLTVSLALFPVTMPAAFATEMNHAATWYGRLAREGEQRGHVYYGTRRVPPDAFAVDAEKVFRGIARRSGQRAAAFRVMACGIELPPALIDVIGAAVSPPVSGEGSHLDSERADATWDVRWFTGPEGESQARWNLHRIDCLTPPAPSDSWPVPRVMASYARTLPTLADPADAASLFRLPIAVDGTVTGFSVRRGRFGHEETYRSAGSSIRVGNLPSRGMPVHLSKDALVRHTLVCGSAGSGKTTTVIELLRQLWLDHHVPFLVIEPLNSTGNDYRKLATLEGFDGLRTITVADELLTPLRFNPFQVPHGVAVGQHLTNLLDCFTAAFGLWSPLPDIYRAALVATYGDRNILTSEVAGTVPHTWPTVVDFFDSMTRVLMQPPFNAYSGEVKSNIEAATLVRARQLTMGVCASTFLTDVDFDAGDLLDGPCILELEKLGNGDEQALMMALLLNAMTEWYKTNRPPVSTLVHLTVVEEAHRLLTKPEGGASQKQARAKEQAAQAFANTLADNRKYGEGVLLAEQVPTKLVADAIANTNVKVLHLLTDDTDRRRIADSMALDDKQRTFAARLVAGEAIVSSDAFAEATHVAVRPALPRSSAATLPAPPRSAVPPFTGCGPCRAKCEYRAPALAVASHGPARERIRAARVPLQERPPPGGGMEDNTAHADATHRWEALASALRQTVRTFPALPSAEPGLSDAAFCVFLHCLALDVPEPNSAWPNQVAYCLELTDTLPDQDEAR